MTEVMEQVAKRTDEVFSAELVVPAPGEEWKRKMDALSEASLTSQRCAMIFDMRCWQAEKMGFKRIESGEMVRMVMGEAHTHTTDAKDRQNYEWMYDHHNDKQEAPSTWGGTPTMMYRMERKGFWYAPPFKLVEKWRCQFGKLDYLKREIPYGVVLRMNEVRKVKLFNCFNVLAPMEAWERKTDIDPVLVATIWEMPLDQEGKAKSAGQAAHFFLAQWK